MTAKKPTVYLPSLPSLSSDDLDLYSRIHDARIDLVTQLNQQGFAVRDIDGQRPWLKTMIDHAEKSDAFIFPPMTSLPERHPRYKSEAAQRWFEFFSLVTGMHVGSREKYQAEGVSKPCVVMDPDNQWASAVDLLKDLHAKGMFSSEVDDIVQIVRDGHSEPQQYHNLNQHAVRTLNNVVAEKRGKTRKDISMKYAEDHEFEPFRKEISRHPFGALLFGSATTTEPTYTNAAFRLAEMIGQRGWRMITGGMVDGCMGAADTGFEAGRSAFNHRYRNAPFKPAHIGVSTQAILRLEGPPRHMDQLIVANNIYDRIKIMIKGNKSPDKVQRARDAVKVIFVLPGGTGTLHEFATLMQLATNGNMMDDRKVVLLNLPNHLNAQEGFWDPLIKTAQKLGFDSMFEVARSPEQAIAIADRIYAEWVDRHPEFKAMPHPELNPNPRLLAGSPSRS